MADIHHLLEGKVVLYRRAGSSRWQARFRRNSESGWDRFATGKDDLEQAKEVALRTFFEIGVKAEHGIAIGSRHSFTKVAEEVIAELEVKQRRPIRGSVDRVPGIGVTAQSPFDLRRAWPVYQAAATGGRLTRGSSPIVATDSRVI